MNKPAKLPVYDRFLSVQGEGLHSGCLAFMVRTYGCPVHCPWCDAAGTWHKDYVPQRINRMDVAAICKEADVSDAEFISLTGGEPCIHEEALVRLYKEPGRLPIHLETCGAFELPPSEGMDWVTVSPNHYRRPTKVALMSANEIKIVVEAPGALEEWEYVFDELLFSLKDYAASGRSVWLVPEWSKRDTPEVRQEILNAVKLGRGYRAGWQMHKCYNAHTQDPRACAPVPLGGEVTKGH